MRRKKRTSDTPVMCHNYRVECVQPVRTYRGPSLHVIEGARSGVPPQDAKGVGVLPLMYRVWSQSYLVPSR
jgi:hypothetical protein